MLVWQVEDHMNMDVLQQVLSRMPIHPPQVPLPRRSWPFVAPGLLPDVIAGDASAAEVGSLTPEHSKKVCGA